MIYLNTLELKWWQLYLRKFSFLTFSLFITHILSHYLCLCCRLLLAILYNKCVTLKLLLSLKIFPLIFSSVSHLFLYPNSTASSATKAIKLIIICNLHFLDIFIDDPSNRVFPIIFLKAAIFTVSIICSMFIIFILFSQCMSYHSLMNVYFTFDFRTDIYFYTWYYVVFQILFLLYFSYYLKMKNTGKQCNKIVKVNQHYILKT